MYQTSLAQFLVLFNESMDKAEKASLASKRVEKIIETLTYNVYRYINRGLYEADKLTFVLLVTMKILITAGHLRQSDLTLFLRGKLASLQAFHGLFNAFTIAIGGAGLDIASVRKKPFAWLSSNEVWLNIIELSQQHKFFANLPNDLAANETMWRQWFVCSYDIELLVHCHLLLRQLPCFAVFV
jgi:dynein heavy chain